MNRSTHHRQRLSKSSKKVGWVSVHPACHQRFTWTGQCPSLLLSPVTSVHCRSGCRFDMDRACVGCGWCLRCWITSLKRLHGIGNANPKMACAGGREKVGSLSSFGHVVHVGAVPTRQRQHCVETPPKLCQCHVTCSDCSGCTC